MKKYINYLIVSLLAFGLGFVSVAILSFENSYSESFTNHKKIQHLTFEETELATSCGWIVLTETEQRTIKSSDGENLILTIRGFESEVVADKWIKSKLEKADKIVESEFLFDKQGNKLSEKVIFASSGKGFILDYRKGSKNYDSPTINFIETPTLQHAIAYDKSQKLTILQRDTSTDELFKTIK